MDGTIDFALVTALMALVGVAAALDGQRRARRAATAAGMCLTLLVLRAILSARPAWEAALFPSATYAACADAWMWPFAIAFFALIAGAAPAGWRRSLAGAMSVAMLVGALWSNRWLLGGEVAGDPLARADANHQCVQSQADTCAPAACVALLSYWGIDADEREMAGLCLTTHGTTIFDAYRGLRLRIRDRGLRARLLDLSFDEVRRLGVPVLFGDGGHARVLVVQDGLCIVHDPALPAPEVWSPHRVERLMRGPVIAIDSLDGASPSRAPAAVTAVARWP